MSPLSLEWWQTTSLLSIVVFLVLILFSVLTVATGLIGIFFGKTFEEAAQQDKHTINDPLQD